MLTVTKKQLIELKGLSDAKVEKSTLRVAFPKSLRLFAHTILTLFWRNAKVLEACAKILPTEQAGGFVTATEFMELRRDTIHIKTGAETVDSVLGGGVPTRSITEMYGEWRTGKTQSTCCVSQIRLSVCRLPRVITRVLYHMARKTDTLFYLSHQFATPSP